MPFLAAAVIEPRFFSWGLTLSAFGLSPKGRIDVATKYDMTTHHHPTGVWVQKTEALWSHSLSPPQLTDEPLRPKSGFEFVDTGAAALTFQSVTIVVRDDTVGHRVCIVLCRL